VTTPASALDIIPLQAEHLADAAALASRRYRRLRETVSVMPPRYENPWAVLPLLSELAGSAPGVAALRGGQLAGFLSGYLLPAFRGQPAAYSQCTQRSPLAG
jgi:hypothetical protein